MALPSVESQARFYDQHWSTQSYAGRLKLRRASLILAEVAALNLSNPTFVELGCGRGWLTAILGQFGESVGYELSPATVAQASARYPTVHYEACDVSSEVPTDRKFSVVISHEVIEHVEDQAKHMRTARNLLEPGGHLILTTPNAQTFDAMAKAEREGWSNQPIEDWIDRNQTRRLASDAGLEIVKLTTILPGWGRGGVRSVVNDKRVAGVARRTGLARQFDQARCAAGLGLHLLLVARRP